MITTLKKKVDEKNSTENNSDINGRIEYIDQSLRSVDNRLKAVEKRLSNKNIEPRQDSGINVEKETCIENVQVDEISLKLSEIERKLSNLEGTTNTSVINMDSQGSQISLFENRIQKLENLNKITIGKIKVPIEFSGLLAAIVLFATGYLIYSDHWSIIRSSYYPIAIGILFGAVVLLKFVMTNRK